MVLTNRSESATAAAGCGGTVYSGHFMISSLYDDDTSSSEIEDISSENRRCVVLATEAFADNDGTVKGQHTIVRGSGLRHTAAARLGDDDGGAAATAGCRRSSGRVGDDGDGPGTDLRETWPSTGIAGFISRVGQERAMSCSGVTVYIDGSLRKLLECMTLDYSGKLPSPKWKNFNGIKVKVKDKIRLNNIIWREWYRQFKLGLPYVVCQFETPLCDRIHMKPEAVVLEGNYWKRRLESVTSEYKKWRRFFIDHPFSGRSTQEKGLMDEVVLHADMLDYMWNSQLPSIVTSQLLDSGNTVSPPTYSRQLVPQTEPSSSDFSFVDCIFSSFSQSPSTFSHSRNTGSCSVAGSADVMQPSLTQLQPTLEEMMDTLEPLPMPGQRHAYRKTSYDGASTNNKRSILTAILTARKTSNGKSEPMAIPGNNRTGLTTQVTQSDPMMNSYGDPVTSPSTATDCRILRRKLGTGFVPSFAGMALSNNSNRLGSSPIGREPLEVKPYSDGVVDSWFDSSSRGGCSDGGGQMPADPRPVDLQLQQQQPARADAIARTSFCRSNDTMAPSGISIKNVRRMSTLLDDLNNRNANNASRRASTGSLPPAAEIEFCVPQAKPIRSPHRHSIGSRPQQIMHMLSRHPSAAEQGMNLHARYMSQSGSQLSDSNSRMSPLEEKESIFRLFSTDPSSGPLSQSPSHVLKQRREQSMARQHQIDQRRALHISSEKKRRTNIKNEFERMEELITVMTGRPAGKCSKAAVLHQAAVMCNELKLENQQREIDIESLKRETEELEVAIRTYCAQLPSTGVPVLQPKTAVMGKLFDDYVRSRAATSWKFWIFGFFIRPLFESFAHETSVVDVTSFMRVIDRWLNDHCSLVRLRRAASTELMSLSKQTSILDDPSRFRLEIQDLVMNQSVSSDTLLQLTKLRSSFSVNS